MAINTNQGALYFDPSQGALTQMTSPGLRQVGPQIYNPQGGGSVLGAATVDPNAAAAAATAKASAANDAAINSAVGRLGTQQSVGAQNILGSYNSAYDQLMGRKAADLQTLGNQQHQAMTDNQTARDNIGAGVRTTYQGLQRLLGSHGAGNSSAAQILAPLAAAQQGNIQRAQLQQTYGQNMNSIDQAISGANTDYANSFGSLAADRQQKERDLASGIDSTRAQLLGQRSDAASNQAAINALLDNVAKLGVNVNFTPQAPTVKAPDLAKYNYTPTGAPTTGGDAGVDPAQAAAYGPFLSLLTGQKKQSALLGA